MGWGVGGAARRRNWSGKRFHSRIRAVKINYGLTASDLVPAIDRLFDLSAGKIRSIEATCPPDRPSPVFTVDGRYTARGWTEWTRGFQYGSAILQFDARPS